MTIDFLVGMQCKLNRQIVNWNEFEGSCDSKRLAKHPIRVLFPFQ